MTDSKMALTSAKYRKAPNQAVQTVLVEHCASLVSGNHWNLDVKCFVASTEDGWNNIGEVFPGAKMEVGSNKISVTLPPSDEELELAAFGTPGEKDKKRMQMAIFGRKPIKGKNWIIRVHVYDDSKMAFENVYKGEKEKGSKLLTARAGLLVANSDEDIKIELQALEPGWQIKGGKFRTIKSKDAWNSPENATDFPCCHFEICHVDETKESFFCTVTASHGTGTAVADVMEVFKQKKGTDEKNADREASEDFQTDVLSNSSIEDEVIFELNFHEVYVIKTLTEINQETEGISAAKEEENKSNQGWMDDELKIIEVYVIRTLTVFVIRTLTAFDIPRMWDGRAFPFFIRDDMEKENDALKKIEEHWTEVLDDMEKENDDLKKIEEYWSEVLEYANKRQWSNKEIEENYKKVLEDLKKALENYKKVLESILKMEAFSTAKKSQEDAKKRREDKIMRWGTSTPLISSRRKSKLIGVGDVIFQFLFDFQLREETDEIKHKLASYDDPAIKSPLDVALVYTNQVVFVLLNWQLDA